MHITTITVRDHAGIHVGAYVPPASVQARIKAPALPARFDRAAVMNKAWEAYGFAVAKGYVPAGGFNRARWADCLKLAWSIVKGERSISFKPVVYSNPTRAAAITGELRAIDLTDLRTEAQKARQRDLTIELDGLTA